MNVYWLVPFRMGQFFSVGVIAPELTVDLPDVNINASCWLSFYWPVLGEEPYAVCRISRYQYIDEAGIVRTEDLTKTKNYMVNWIQISRCVSITFECRIVNVTAQGGGMIYYVE